LVLYKDFAPTELPNFSMIVLENFLLLQSCFALIVLYARP
jgi:hypothetical protein